MGDTVGRGTAVKVGGGSVAVPIGGGTAPTPVVADGTGNITVARGTEATACGVVNRTVGDDGARLSQVPPCIARKPVAQIANKNNTAMAVPINPKEIFLDLPGLAVDDADATWETGRAEDDTGWGDRIADSGNG